MFGGRDRDRTCDLVVANDALSQLSYTPTCIRYFSKATSGFQTGPESGSESSFTISAFGGAEKKAAQHSQSRLIERAAVALGHNFARVLIERPGLRNGFDAFLHLRVGFEQNFEPILHAKR